MNLRKISEHLIIISFLFTACAPPSSEPKSSGSKDVPFQNPFYDEVNPVGTPLDIETHFDIFNDVAWPVIDVVDQQYSMHKQLTKSRSISSSTHPIDNCRPELVGKNSFGERIAWAVEQKMRPTIPRLGYVATTFRLPPTESMYMETGLLSHPLCYVDPGTIATVYQGKNIPSNATLNKVNTFIQTMNEYRRKAYEGDEIGYLKAQKLWTKLFMCLSYMESLTTADNTKSVTTSQKYLDPMGLTKPPGVSFHEDTRHTDPHSVLGMGLFQFGAYSGGNTQSCIREWNDQNPTCAISRTAGVEEMIKMVGSSHQTFNAYCAVAKTTGMFGVQVNTTRASNTFPLNVLPNGSIKPRAERCVAFTMNVNTSYNHFGPYQNSSGFTLDNIVSCALTGEY